VDLDQSGEPRALQMAVVTYTPEPAEAPRAGLEVDLIGAVHIGDLAYYESLNDRFAGYDVVLYELVAPQDALPQPDSEQQSMISSTQRGLRTMLGLEFQLDHIDYAAANLVHADLSPDEFRDNMTDRGESLYVYFWRAFYASMRDASRDPLGLRSWQMLSAMLTTDDTTAARTMVAYEMTRIDQLNQFLDGGANGSALIAGRNQRAMDVLEAELAKGHRRIGIFYGVAHMPDFERRLGSRFRLRPTSTDWVDAWQLGATPR
ncbi:MAG: hypothetical protein AAGA61_09025, partial [Pseudomonadota bacterium]